MIRVTKSEWRSLSIAVLVSTATLMFNHRSSAAQVAPTFEASVLTEINKIRANPQAYADWLTTQRQNYQNNLLHLPGEERILTHEGLSAMNDAIAFLRTAPTLPLLSLSPELSNSARNFGKINQRYEPSPQPVSKPAPKIEKVAEIEKAIVDETNRLRSNPQAYAAELEELRQYFKGNILKVPGYPALKTHEGVAAVDEAIRDLKATPPLSTLTLSQGLSLGARDHVQDLGPKGKAGHYGTDGSDPFQRMNRYGTWNGTAGENISFSPIATAKWHVMQLVIDDGVKNRGHRKALLNPDYRLTGSACGDHSVYGQMCVMTYSKEYTEGNVQGRR